ncbi:MAG: hypothetical protein HY906_08605 [Deltaproteobacteria bacterium]|nr:hypothetical protein [Deltaproteobacteria bacterium]
MQITCEVEGLSIVLVGNFNPAIFQPTWLARQGLISDAAATNAEIDIIRPELTSFKVGGLKLLVQLDRFQAEAVTPDEAGRVRDLVVGTFRILEHTPVRQMGINRHMHFRMASETVWHAVGHRLAPKEAWKGLLENPGTRSLVIEGQRPGSPSRRFAVTVQPSQRVQPGVYIGTNEHYEASGDEGPAGLMEMLAAQFEPSQQYARQLAENLLGECQESDE